MYVSAMTTGCNLERNAVILYNVKHGVTKPGSKEYQEILHPK